MREKISLLLKSLALFFLCLWTIIAFARTVFNISKLPFEENPWLVLSDQQKRQKIFGTVYDYIMFIDKNTKPNSSILSLYEEDKTHYLGRYYLFPKKFVNYYHISDVQKTLEKNCYDYVAFDMNNRKQNIAYLLLKYGYIQEKVMKKGIHEFIIYIKK